MGGSVLTTSACCRSASLSSSLSLAVVAYSAALFRDRISATAMCWASCSSAGGLRPRALECTLAATLLRSKHEVVEHAATAKRDEVLDDVLLEQTLIISQLPPVIDLVSDEE